MQTAELCAICDCVVYRTAENKDGRNTSVLPQPLCTSSGRLSRGSFLFSNASAHTLMVK